MFTGIGAMTYALAGIAKPKLYCDVSSGPRALIARKQATKEIPKARIHDDITTLAPSTLGKIDMVVGGWPCTGHSARGKRLSFENEHSKLFFELVRVVRDSKAHAVFMENVPGVSGVIDDIRNAFSSMGFLLRWTVVGASDVGAPQVRRRWFCLAFRPRSKLLRMKFEITGRHYTRFDWSSPAPSRTRKMKGPEEVRANDTRLALLGNGLVPDAARLAFFRLLTAGQVTHLPLAGSDTVSRHGSKTKTVRYVSYEQACEDAGGPSGSETAETDTDISSTATAEIAHVGINGKELRIACERIVVPKVRHKPIVLDPKLLPRPLVKSPNQTTPLLRKPVSYKHWATPRHGMLRPCRVLTDRSSRDLPTQIVFETRTKNRHWATNADFVDWLMGLRPGFTSLG